MHPLFRVQVEHLAKDERVSLAYERAKLMMDVHGLSVEDVKNCSKRFWDLFTDPVCCLDIGMFTILMAHIGLAIGTLSRHLDARPDLQGLVEELLRFDKVGLYLLTERGHGLDSFNIETTATRLPDGTYVLNTPREEAAKFMPASTPSFGIPKVALVMARLINKGEDFGCRNFVVPICNEKEMYRGVKSIRLPPRSGTGPLDFSITSFHNVRLPATALVSSTPHQITAPANPLAAWWGENWRIQHGTGIIASPMLHAIKASAYIVGSYSMERCITDRQNKRVPIFTFRTQQWPVASATAVGYVLDNWYADVIEASRDPTLVQHLRHAKAVIVKTTIIRHFQRAVPELAERWTFEHNFMARVENDGKGTVIAEGELLTLCIRLFSELLLERYTVDIPDERSSLLARHAHGLMAENKEMLAGIGGHRSTQFNALMLPQAQAAIEAMGHAFAYEAAQKANLPKPILDMYECTVMRQDPAWYSEADRISRISQHIREDRAISSMLPDMRAYLTGLNVAELVTAPIVSDATWKTYVSGLTAYTGNAVGPGLIVQALL
ncbi:acyl-CoA oxidase [Mycena latifolia]|nr:acyl-CoA oxidase [Mycena latifolia]